MSMRDKNTPDTRERDIPEHQQILAEFPKGYLITSPAAR